MAAASALLHAVLLASLLLSLPRSTAPPGEQPLVIELVRSEAMAPGNVPQPRPPPQPPQPSDGVGPTAPKPPPPNVNIGNALEQNDPLTVTGDNVVPPEPDARFRNQPPHYPVEAARVGAEGTAQLVIHVSVQGRAVGVRVIQSSGNRSLDGEARRAVALWRFRPALRNGHPVEFDYPINIHFAIGDHP